MTYVIRKNGSGSKPWTLGSETKGWFAHLGSYSKRKEAITVARIMAGRRGKVEIR
jgi:hypothetical protein